MRAVTFAQAGGPEVLQIEEVPSPVPKPGEVLLDVVATAVNRADLMQRAGNYPPPPGASEILGLECSGRIAALGDGVTGWAIGEQVCALLTGGGYAEQVCVAAIQLMKIPGGIGLIEAAALPEVACTVWSMVFDEGRLGLGETFLVHGGSSGIGTMAIQLAAAAGARVFATAGSEAKLQVCRELGADVVINYWEQDFAQVVQAETDGAGIDVLLDTVGAKYLSSNVASLALGGRLQVIGLLGGSKGELNLAQLLVKRASVHAAGLRARPEDQKAAIVAGTEAHVWPLLALGTVKPVIDSVLPLADVQQAHRRVESSEHVGKVLLTTESPG